MRVFVTGLGGTVGRNVARAVAQLAPGTDLVGNRADLTDARAIREEVAEAGPIDRVIHLAAVVPVADVLADPARAFAVNVGGTINLLWALSDQPAHFLHCSTSHVYAASPQPIVETAALAPSSLYGKSKMLAEMAVAELCEAQGRPHCIARLFSIHDPAQTGTFLRPAIERRLAEADLDAPFPLPGAQSERDFLTAAEAARLLLRLSLLTATGRVNVGSGKATTIADFVQSLSDRRVDIRPEGPADRLIADITKLEQILGEHDAGS